MNRNDKLTISYGLLEDTADAIRTKKGTSALISPTDFPSEIESISGGGESPISLKATYKNNTPANAYGEIVLSASDDDYSGDYDIMWGDANGVMSNYSKIDTITLDVANNKTMASIEFIDFNAIPKYTTRICAVQNGEIVASFNIPSAKLWDSEYYGEHLYSFGLISDPHIQYSSGVGDVRKALSYFNDRESVDFTAGTGDLTSEGSVAQCEEWVTERDTYSPNTPVYTCNGNHEARYATSIMDASNIATARKYLDSDWTDETVPYFVKVINNDVFVFVSIFNKTIQNASNVMFPAEELTWLEGVLEQYRNQRVFLFAHVPAHWNTAGIKYNGFGLGNGAYSTDIWGNPQVSNRPMADRTAFLNLLDHYKNVIWFSGHSHIKYEYQKIWKNLNIMQYKGGARFVHVSSLTVPRDIVDGSVTDYIYAESEGAVVDVYPNAIRMRCRNFVGEKFYGMCEYIIDTTPVTIPSGSKTVVSITATKTKTSYYTDETLSTADITVTATYSDSSTANVSSSAVYDTSNVDLTTEDTYTIGISYTYGEDTVTTSVQVTSTERPATKTLASISATKTTTSYTVNQTLSTSDIVVTATYSDNTTATVSGAVFDTSGVDMTTAGAYTIGVSYTEGGVTKTTTVGIAVSSVSPTVKLDATFNGSIAQAGGEVDRANISINNSKGSVSGSYNLAYVRSDSMLGKDIYYRVIDNGGTISSVNKIGFTISVGGNDHGHDGGSQTNLTSNVWTKLNIKTDSSHKYVNVKCVADSTSEASFPVSVNAEVQIGYVE